ncbi:MAG: 50S ribosomal protein L30e [Methanophagales archaeon]|nr:50S ribosomal protein L30e [Methanophagales archaeon]
MKIKSVELSDVNRELQKLISSGKVLIGSKETLKALRGREEGTKIVIHASNCPEGIKEGLKEIGIGKEGDEKNTVYEYPSNSLELGLACGKPYPIASLCIIDVGESEISRLLSHNFHSEKNRPLRGLRGRGTEPHS